MRGSKKSQYINTKERFIYVLLSPLSKEFFIGHCRKDLLIDVFKDHYYGQRYQTKACFSELKKHDLHPCLFVLEELTCTKVEAFNHVIVWTKIYCAAGYKSLNEGNVMSYIENLLEKNLLIYNERKQKNISENRKCSRCVVANYGRKKCPLYKGDYNER